MPKDRAMSKDRETARRNRRLAWILISIALVMFGGVILSHVLTPRPVNVKEATPGGYA